MTTDDVLDIGGGLGIDRRTLKGVIHDEEAFGNSDPIIGALYLELLGETRTPTLVQHLGKVYFAAGDFVRAECCFAEALRGRESVSESADRLASSQLALRRAREEIARGTNR